MKTLADVQRELAESLVGKHVRFAHLPDTSQAPPIYVRGATANGMVLLEGFAGYFAPHLFVVWEPSESRRRRACRRA
jgi:hypothetical protein